MPEIKKPWLSKTIWLNLAGAILALVYPPASAWLSANAEITFGFFAGLNILLRLVSKDKISLSD